MIEALGAIGRIDTRAIKDGEGVAVSDLDVVMPPSIVGAHGSRQLHSHDTAIEIEGRFHVISVDGDMVYMCNLEHSYSSQKDPVVPVLKPPIRRADSATRILYRPRQTG